MSRVPSIRIEAANGAVPRRAGDFVLYWMIAARRTRWNFGLQRAIEWARELDKPLLVLEALRCDHPWASVRFHAFVLDGMADNAERFARAGVAYHPYVERASGDARGLLESLAATACVIITDDFPCFFMPHMVQAAAARVPILLEVVDSNGLVPLRAPGRFYTSAYLFRRFLHTELPRHWLQGPLPEPLAGVATGRRARPAAEIRRRWPAVTSGELRDRRWLLRLPVSRAVEPTASKGGGAAGRRRLLRFLHSELGDYPAHRNTPDEEATSRLSPYLHFGHSSVHEVLHELCRSERWKPPERPPKPTGKRQGWWGMSAAAEEYLDQIVTWRELGFVFCHYRKNFDRFDSLPRWARTTLHEHRRDRRQFLYDLEDFDAGRTHDPLWNAAQTQLRCEGRIHNYVRMLWGKKILEWSESPEAALQTMIELNNKYALDGRDPNSYSGIFWCLGRFDRAWGPERQIFGTVRFMSSESAARKLRLREYLKRFGTT